MPIKQTVSDRHHESGLEHKPEAPHDDLKQKMDGILSRTLTPDIIDTYADVALDDLIDVVDEAISVYDSELPNIFDSIKEKEDAALKLAGLGSVGELLDHIAEKADEIRRLDSVINRATVINQVIVPTDPGNKIVEGDETLVAKKSIKRTKTLLFILSNDFEIDVHDPEQLIITTGVLTDRMMRKQSYFMVEVPKLKRTIFICDEEDNVTYVFNSFVLEEHGISPDDLLRLMKPDLNYLIQNEHLLGKRLNYSNKFVSNMITALNNPQNYKGEEKETQDAGQYLRPKAPDGILSINVMAKKFGLSHRTIAKAIDELGDDLGETPVYRFGARITKGFNPTQQEQIRNLLESNGVFSEEAPDGVLSIKGIAQNLGVDHYTVAKTIDELGDDLGETPVYRFGQRITKGFNPTQQEQIRQHLESNGVKIKK